MEKEEERSNQRKEQKDHKELRLGSENRMARKGFKREKVCSLETEFWQQ